MLQKYGAFKNKSFLAEQNTGILRMKKGKIIMPFAIYQGKMCYHTYVAGKKSSCTNCSIFFITESMASFLRL